MYEAYPYPTPIAGEGLIGDVANMVAFLLPAGFLSGKRILDAGCGTGHRVLGLAKRWPQAQFLGIDFSKASLRVARTLADQHRIENVQFQQGDLMALEPSQEFDLIVSTGVIHHLEDPGKGLANLSRCLAPGGHIILWLYHPYGEFSRLLERELVLTLWDREKMSFADGIEMMRALRVSLSRDRYSGAIAQKDNQVLNDASINVDGFLHPIVNAYRFHEAFAMLAQCGLHWVAVHSINLGNNSKLIDLGQVSKPSLRMFCLKESDLFQSTSIGARYRDLANAQKLKVIELLMKPNGFSVIAGRTDAYSTLDERIRGNLVHLNAEFAVR